MEKTYNERLMEERLLVLKLLSGTISILIVLNGNYPVKYTK